MRNPLTLIAILLMPAALLALTSCSSPPPASKPMKTTSGAAYETEAGFAGEVVVNSVTMTDTVVSIDAANRKLELKHPDGRITAYKAGPEVVNFDRIKVGDPVKATVVEEMAVSIKPAGSPESLGGSVVVSRVPNGTMPGVKNVDTRSVTGKITALDPWLEQVTLQLANGQNKTVKVPSTINLGDFNVGDMVAVRITDATTILVEKP